MILEGFMSREYPAEMSELRSLLSTAIALGIIIVVAAMLPWGTSPLPLETASIATSSQPAAVAAPRATSTSAVATQATIPSTSSSTPRISSSPPTAATTSSGLAARIENPYPFAPLPTEVLNADARAALVNIFCTPRGGSLAPISGSGVVIDPRGIILTNSHVAQYVLLSESAQVNLVCMIRTGTPASASFTPVILAMPSAWVASHAKEILTSRPQGTGEHDWALLLATPLQSSPSPLPSALPYLMPDTRPVIGFVGDPVLAAGYPAEFVGGSTAQTGLYPVSSVSSIEQLLTFSTSTVDLFSIGSVIEAQGGSSGGPVVNQWDRLIGIITTTSEGTTTAQRDLRALTMDYIDRDMRDQLGYGLKELPNKDIAALRRDFLTNYSESFIEQFVSRLSR